MKFQTHHLRFFVLTFCVVFLLESCNQKNAVERLPEAQIAAEPAEPLVLPASKTVVSNSGLTVNPAHGEPGHRCDIQVGAPLNGSASTTAPSVFAPVNQASVVTNTANVNPAHGQPGHRCDVAVGAPL
ncbi:hypothetical protein U1E44_15105 [Arenibacter sp. GZD96]|uniref:hypothetical protein n=1 Tax=Aurantibrevibacter litoralis TaxID=3106030 RepID=UPI002AFFA68D|nr:hypothetical protein [Arenibacter sp. GZD-96]MEA1787428.1 hypothetical protein [Arenibacter sp. GZD-96]